VGIDLVKALVLEENSRVIELYKKIFEQKRCEADFVEDMFTCLDKIDTNDPKYDFVVLEKSIETKDGNLEDNIRVANPQQKVFFLSPYMAQRAEEFRSVKDTLDLIDKPFAMISLLSSLEINSHRK
jgi:DNA-binding response OmpR family regulator